MSDEKKQEQETAEQGKPSAPNQRQLSLRWSLGAMGLAFAVGLGMGRYVASASDRGGASAGPSATLDSKRTYKIPVSPSQPRIGAAEPLVTLVQWCDLPDPACAELEPVLQALLKRYPNDVSLVFRHYLSDTRRDSPLGHQFTRAALDQGNKFWEARKLLLTHKGEVRLADLERYTATLGLDWSAVKKAVEAGSYSGHVASDRIFAGMFDVQASGALFVNGHPVTGKVTEQGLAKLIDEEIARVKPVLARGVARKDLYAELTKDGTWTPPPKVAKAKAP